MFEEDTTHPHLRDIHTDISEFNCTNTDPLTLEDYDATDPGVSKIKIYDVNRDTFAPAICTSVDELKALVAADMSSAIPNYIMSLFSSDSSTQPLIDPVLQEYIVRIPVNNVYVTAKSFVTLMTTPGEYYAVPLFGGHRRRVGNINGDFAMGMNHGQVPGFLIYKVYTADELSRAVEISADDDEFYSHDYAALKSALTAADMADAVYFDDKLVLDSYEAPYSHERLSAVFKSADLVVYAANPVGTPRPGLQGILEGYSEFVIESKQLLELTLPFGRIVNANNVVVSTNVQDAVVVMAFDTYPPPIYLSAPNAKYIRVSNAPVYIPNMPSLTKLFGLLSIITLQGGEYAKLSSMNFAKCNVYREANASCPNVVDVYNADTLISKLLTDTMTRVKKLFIQGKSAKLPPKWINLKQLMVLQGEISFVPFYPLLEEMHIDLGTLGGIQISPLPNLRVLTLVNCIVENIPDMPVVQRITLDRSSIALPMCQKLQNLTVTKGAVSLPENHTVKDVSINESYVTNFTLKLQ